MTKNAIGCCLPRARRAGFALVAAVMLTQCQPTIDSRGYVPNPEALGQIEPGRQTRKEVQHILGTPSSVAAFNDDAWLYISRKTKTVAFFEPQVLEQNVVVVEFDGAGVVKDVRRYTLADGKVIDTVSRTTPAPGKELSFIEQLVGNLGRFNTGRAPAGGQ
jgi:outer membrane protein assembly factor BamE (lipoprotein component of BamABCDE complex)